MPAGRPRATSRFIAPVPTLRLAGEDWNDAELPLHVKLLKTPEQRQALAELRKLAPMGVEDDLGAGLMPFESLRDQVGMVIALYRGAKLTATLRFVPSGQRLTAAERVRDGIGGHTEILGGGNWEVGRLIVAPDERSPEVLRQCLHLALRTLVDTQEVGHLYAIATPLMARLWRRVGMHAIAPLRGASGRRFMLVSGHVTEVAAALAVPLVDSGAPAVGEAKAQHGPSVALAS